MLDEDTLIKMPLGPALWSDHKVGMNTILYNNSIKLLYLIAQVSVAEVAAICIDPDANANRWSEPVKVAAPMELTSYEINRVLDVSEHDPLDEWELVIGRLK